MVPGQGLVRPARPAEAREEWLPGRPRRTQEVAKDLVVRSLQVAAGHVRRDRRYIDSLLDDLADLIGHAG